jgi:hypothetical protein
VTAADALGWAYDEVIGHVSILGTITDVAVNVDQRAHKARVAAQQPPMLDHDTLTMWEWLDLDVPRAPQVVRLVGTLTSAGRWRAAMQGAARLRGFGSSAVVVDREPDDECLLECALRGIGVVIESGHDEARVVASAACGRAPQARRRVLDRWIEERLYERWLRQQRLAAVGGLPFADGSTLRGDRA